MSLSTDQKRLLLQAVRRTLESFLSGHKSQPILEGPPALMEKGDAFVTLEKKGELRGCIGHMTSEKPLWITVQEMAVQAATGDPRFPPVTRDELGSIEIEISVLSPLRIIKDLSEIHVGEHGLVVSQGRHRGVLLPQVAVREQWDSKTFLSYTCLKAGLPGNAWASGDLTIEVFSAEVFSERDVKDAAQGMD